MFDSRRRLFQLRAQYVFAVHVAMLPSNGPRVVSAFPPVQSESLRKDRNEGHDALDGELPTGDNRSPVAAEVTTERMTAPTNIPSSGAEPARDADPPQQ